MMHDWLPTLLGLAAGVCTAYAFIPQVLKIWRENDTGAISLRMYILRVAGFGLWLAYGVALASMPLIVFNILNLLLGGMVLLLKLRHRSPGAMA